MNKEADQQNSLPSSGWLEADTRRSSDQQTPIDNTSECSTETKESGGWGSGHVNQITGWLDENSEVTDANSEGCPPPNTGSDYSGWGQPLGTDPVSSWLNGNTDSSDSGSEGDSSDSSVDSSLLGEDPPLAEIPLTAKEKKLIGEFYEKMKGVYDKNIQSCCIAVEALLKTYLSEGIRLNSPYDNEPTVSGLVLKKIKDALAGTIELTSGLRRRDPRMDECPSEGELDDKNNIDAVVNVVRKLFFKGGKVELDTYDNEDGHDRLCRMVWKSMDKFNEEREQIYGVLKSAAYEGIVNKDAQVQEDDLVVDVDNCYFYTKYPQDSTIEVAKAVNGLKKAVNDLKKVTNDLKIEELNFKYYIFHIGESIVRFEEDKDEKRNYTDVLQGSIEVSFATKVGKISVHLHPSSTETEDGKTENREIKVEIDEESKTRFSQLEDEEKKSLGKNCLLKGQSVADVIAKSLEKNGSVTMKLTEKPDTPFTFMNQTFPTQEAGGRYI